MIPDKEKILERHFGNYAYRFGGSGTIDLYCSLDEYAKEVAIAFHLWLVSNFQHYLNSTKYMKMFRFEEHDSWPDPETIETFTIEQLYQLFLKQQEKL